MTDVAAPEGIEADAAWYAENHARFWRTLSRLRAYVAENGPIALSSGKVVSYYADGYSWDGDLVAQVMPSLISEVEAGIVGSLADVERGLSLLLEEVPNLRVGTVKRTVDRDAANGMLRSGGAAAEKLAPCRLSKSKLGVK